MRCKMKAMIMDMCILSHKTQCFLLLGHVVDVGAGKLRCFTVILPIGFRCSDFPLVKTNPLNVRISGEIWGESRGRESAI